jgi:hypothetical protein
MALVFDHVGIHCRSVSPVSASVGIHSATDAKILPSGVAELLHLPGSTLQPFREPAAAAVLSTRRRRHRRRSKHLPPLPPMFDLDLSQFSMARLSFLD